MMIKSGFRNFVDTASEIRPEVDGSFAQSMIPFGVQYLDRALSGIFPNDLIIVGAATGAGKSELATTIALHNAELGNRVAFFALEAHHGEIELRTKFKLYARQMRERNMLPPSFGYEDFILGRYTAELQPFVTYVESYIAERFSCIDVFYRDKAFSSKDFEREFAAISGKDIKLCVIDHLHYFDFEGDNENQAISDIMKKIKDMSQVTGIPVILVGHLRKRERGTHQLVPNADDFMGTSNISKIATKVITMSSGGVVDKDPSCFYTYMRVAKNRYGSRAIHYVAGGIFDTRVNDYVSKRWALGKLTNMDSKFEGLDEDNFPSWYKERAK